MYDLKEKKLGETCKRTSEMSDVSGAITNSALLMSHLYNYLDIACLAKNQEITTAKKLHCHMKTFDSILTLACW